jgi:hypothetical protein
VIGGQDAMATKPCWPVVQGAVGQVSALLARVRSGLSAIFRTIAAARPAEDAENPQAPRTPRGS